MINKDVITVTLDGEETELEFSDGYSYYEITNKSGTDFYASLSPNITPEAEGVYTIAAGGSEIIGNGSPFKKFYILGEGKAYIRGKSYAMSSSFKRGRKGGGKNEPLVILKGTETECVLSGGLTGFTIINENSSSFTVYDDSLVGINIGVKSVIFDKTGRFNADGNYIDSGIFATVDEIDLTNYNTILVDFYYASNYSNTGYINNMGDIFFKIDQPINLPQQNIVYEWDGWDNMHGYNRKDGKYYMDISNIFGRHKLCFGIQHGSYSNAYDNALAIYKITLS